jgi:radical SAM superfamily enzyme YgiQ (UPF0313 family)
METVFIVDDNLIGNKKAIRVVLRAVVSWQQANDFPIMFLTEASIDLADDPELLALMSEANIRVIFVGIETPNNESLRETGKLQNLRKGGSMIDKVHRIQEAGIEVWSGQIVGFDNDGPDIFDRQIAFIEEAGIVTSMVGMLSAIPKTPLHARLAEAGRLDLSDQPESGTNVIPQRLGRDELREGYVRIMRTLYAPDAYFDRVRLLYLTGPLASLEHWPKRRGVSRLTRIIVVAAQAAFIAVRLLTRVDDRSLRRVYRSMIGEALSRRSPQLLQILVIKCAMHYHAARLIRDMLGSQRLVNTI